MPPLYLIVFKLFLGLGFVVGKVAVLPLLSLIGVMIL
jgi:hypothetical protein